MFSLLLSMDIVVMCIAEEDKSVSDAVRFLGERIEDGRGCCEVGNLNIVVDGKC